MEIKNLIDRLDDWDGVDAIYNGEFVEVNHHGVFRLLEEAAAALEQLQAENDRLKKEIQQMRWIPVEERLPEEEGVYIVCVDGEVKWDAYCMFEGVERWLCYDGRLNALYIDPYSSKLTREPPYPRVTHWMPLPSAPKEASHD